MYTFVTDKSQLAIFCVLDSQLSAPVMSTTTKNSHGSYYMQLSRADVLLLAKAVQDSDYDQCDEITGFPFNEAISEILFEVANDEAAEDQLIGLIL